MYKFNIYQDGKKIGGRYTTPFKIGVLIGRLTLNNPDSKFYAQIVK